MNELPNLKTQKDEISGAVVMVPTYQMPDITPSKPAASFVKENGAIVIQATQDEIPPPAAKSFMKTKPTATVEGGVISTPSDMTEVPWNDMAKKVSAAQIQDNVKKLTATFVGAEVKQVEKMLANMVETAMIGSFKVLRTGEFFTSDYVADRVKVFTNKDGFVKNVEVG